MENGMKKAYAACIVIWIVTIAVGTYYRIKKAEDIADTIAAVVSSCTFEGETNVVDNQEVIPAYTFRCYDNRTFIVPKKFLSSFLYIKGRE